MRRNPHLIQIEDLGMVEYETAWNLQDRYALEIAEGIRPPTLLLLEHPHVYTFGRRGRSENLLWGEDVLRQKGISIYWVDRGGDITYHGPGQLVGYPLLPLGRAISNQITNGVDYMGYVRRLETVLIRSLAGFGIAAGQIPGKTGVWIQADVHSRCLRCLPQERKKPAKIASIGIKVDSHGISRHGFALNVDPDMDYWEGIVACGLNDPTASLADVLSHVPSMDEVKQEILTAFHSEFDQ